MARYFKITIDWDGTLTTSDTMFMMAEIVRQRDARLGLSTTPEQAWKGYGEAYVKDYDAHRQTYIPVMSERRNADSECVWLQSLRGVEDRSAQRIEADGYFKNVKQSDIVAAVREALATGAVKLRKDWHKLFVESATARAGMPLPPNAHVYELGILSVNWSETMIRTFLELSVDELEHIDEVQRRNVKDLIEHMGIQANEIVGLQAQDGSSGSLTRPNKLAVRTSLDKLQSYARSLDQIHVYVGDSVTDLDCLLAADVGICIHDQNDLSSTQQQLSDTLTRVNIVATHVSDHRHVVEKDDMPAEAKLWYAHDFGQISAFLSRITVTRA